MSLFSRLQSVFRRRGRGAIQANAAEPQFQAAPDPDPALFTMSASGVRPVIVKTETAVVPGVQPLRFMRRELRFRDDQNAKYSGFEVTRVVLAGCNCVVSGPNEVAYLSDISGLPVCTKCARVCICGHKVGPLERIMVEPNKFMCNACHEQLRRQARWAAIGRLIWGPFITQEKPNVPTAPPPDNAPVDRASGGTRPEGRRSV